MEKNMEMIEVRELADELIKLATFYKNHLSKTSNNFTRLELLEDVEEILLREMNDKNYKMLE